MNKNRKRKFKIVRERIYWKYNGHCAYCGCEIELHKFQIDHIHPLHWAHEQPDLDPNREENLNPSCGPCNLFKKSWRLEEFREELTKQVQQLIKYSSQFRRALRYNLVEVTGEPIQFYFEKKHENPYS